MKIFFEGTWQHEQVAFSTFLVEVVDAVQVEISLLLLSKSPFVFAEEEVRAC